MSEHVATPWYAEPDPKSGKWSINNGFETFIDVRSGIGGLPAEDTAKFIVKACNAYEHLVSALRMFVDYYTQAGIGDCTQDDEDAADNGDRDDEFDGDEIFNVRFGREALRLAKGGKS